MAADRGWLRAGAVGSPHGLDGSFYVNQPNAQLLVLDATVTVGGEELRITRRAGTDLRPIVRLAGYEDRNAVSALRGQELLAPRSDAPELGAEEWWVEDLEGCTVRDSGRELGTVRRVLALPSCEVLEVVLADGGGELLVPLVSDAVQTVDIERREILVNVQFLRDG
jgi:16S rRNA processing protein RimM